MSYLAGEIEARLVLDRTPFSAGLAAARKEAAALEGKTYTAKLDASDSAVKRKVESVRNDLRRVSKQVARPKVDVEVQGAAKLTGLAAKIRSLPRHREVKVDVDTRGAGGKIDGLIGKMGGLARAAVGGGLLFGGSLARGALGAGALGVAVGGAGLAFGALGLAAKSQLGEASDQQKKYTQQIIADKAKVAAAQLAVDNATTASGKLAAEQRLALAQQQLDSVKAQQAAEGNLATQVVKGAHSMKQAFISALGPGVRPVFAGLLTAMDTLKGSAGGLKGPFLTLGKAVGAAFSSPETQAGLRSLISGFGKLVTATAPLAGPLLKGVIALGKTFLNIATAAMPDLVREVSKLADWLQKVAGSDQSKLKDQIHALVGQFDKWVTIAIDLVKALAPLFRGGLGSAMTSILGIAVKLVGAFTKLLDKMGPLGDLIAGGLGLAILAGRFSALGKGLGIALKGVKALAGAFGLLKTAEEGAASASLLTRLKGIGKGGAAAGAAGQMSMFPASAGKAATADAAKAGTAAGKTGFIASLLTAIKGGGGKVTGGIKGLLSKIGPLFRRIPGLGAIATVIGAAFTALPGKVGPKLTGAFGKVFGLLGRALPTFVRTLLPRVLGAFLGWPVAIGLLLYTLLPGKVKDALKKGIGKALGAVKDAGVAVVKAVGGGIAAGAQWVAKAASDVAKKAWAAIKKRVGEFLKVGKEVILAVAKGATAAGTAVWNAAKSIATKAWGIIKGFAGKFLQVGKLLIEKVVAGVKSVVGRVVGAAKSVGDAALKIITGLAGRFFDAGKAIIGKLIEGIKSMAGAVGDAIGGIASSVTDILPGSEPKDTSSPLYGLGRRGRAIADNIAKGVHLGKGGLRGAMGSLLEEAYKPIRAAAKAKLSLMDYQDAAAQGPAPTRGQQIAEVAGRVNAARYAVDENGVPVNNPPPGVKRVASWDERDAMAEQTALARDFERQDTEAAANVKISALLPSDPRVLREAQRAIGRSVSQGRRKHHRAKRRS